MAEKVIEPRDYFENFKSKLQETSREEAEKKIAQVEKLIKEANEIGQVNLAKNLKLVWRACISELVLSDNGITKYVKKDAIQQYIDKVEPRNSVKIIELDRYPRIIPEKNRAEIKRIKDLNLFDEICVLFTDLTNKEYKTKEEKEFVRKNRDPICFGFFMDRSDNEKYGNFYFITDWEDDYCDLTYDKVIDKLSKRDHGELSTDSLEEKWKRYYEFKLNAKPLDIKRRTTANITYTGNDLESISLFGRIKRWFK